MNLVDVAAVLPAGDSRESARRARGVRPDGCAPADQARRTPFEMRAVRVRHVLGDRREAWVVAPAMHPDPRAAVKDFERGGGEAHVDGLLNQPMRHGVEVVLDIDVVIDVHAHLAPLGVDEAFRGQGPERGLVEAEKEIAAGLPAVALHRPRVEVGEELADPRVQRGE